MRITDWSSGNCPRASFTRMDHQTLLCRGGQHESVLVMDPGNRQPAPALRAGTFGFEMHPFVGRKCAMKPDAVIKAGDVKRFARLQVAQMTADAAEVKPPVRQIRENSRTCRRVGGESAFGSQPVSQSRLGASS